MPRNNEIGPLAETPTPEEITARVRELRSHIVYHGLERPTSPYGSHEDQLAIESTLFSLFPHESWAQEDFDSLGKLSQTTGSFVEVGGPTLLDGPMPGGYKLINLAAIYEQTGRKIIVTNKSEEELDKPIPDKYRPVMERGGLVDATAMPYDKQSIGALFASALGIYVFPRFFVEAPRVLEDGGLLVCRLVDNLEVAHMLALGFEMKQYSRFRHTWRDRFYDDLWETVMQKPAPAEVSS